jgi:hypothetical protein
MVGEIFISDQVSPGRNRSLQPPRRPVFAGQRAKTTGSIPGSSTKKGRRAAALLLLLVRAIKVPHAATTSGLFPWWRYGPNGWAVRNFVNATGPSWKGSTAYPLRTQEWLGPGIGGRSDDGHSSVPDVWH